MRSPELTYNFKITSYVFETVKEKRISIIYKNSNEPLI